MLPVRSVLVDFDGTACLHDVAEHVMNRFGEPDWAVYDEAWERGEIDTRAAIRTQVAPFAGPADELNAFAVEHCPVDPTLAGFVRWCRDQDVDVAIVSDGLGFYIAPLLAAAGVPDVAIVTNEWDGGRMAFPNGHPLCTWCGTCKMQAVQAAPGPVAFIGEGSSDRYGALYADLVFAKDALVDHCQRDGVAFVAWKDFDDVRRVLESAGPTPGPVAPDRCPGWNAG